MRSRSHFRTAILILLAWCLCFEMGSGVLSGSRRFRNRKRIQRERAKQRTSRDASKLVRDRPVEVFPILAQHGNGLDSRQRNQLALQAIAALASSLDDIDAGSTAQQLRESMDQLRLDENCRRQLMALIRELDERTAVELLNQVLAAVDGSDWGGAEASASRAGQLETPACLPDMQDLFNRVAALARAQRALQEISRLRSKDQTATPPDAGLLKFAPAELRQKAEQIVQLDRLIRQTETESADDPSIVEWNELFANLSTLSAPDEFVQQFRLEITIKLFLDGRANTAKALLPTRMPVPLRDARIEELNRFLVGKGQVRSWPFRPYFEQNAGLPAAVTQLSPTAQRTHWRQELELLPDDEGSSLQRIASLRSRHIAEIMTLVDSLQDTQRTEQQQLSTALRDLQRTIAQEHSGRQQRLAAIAEQAGRPLSPLESMIASELDCRNTTPEEILAVLNSLSGTTKTAEAKDTDNEETVVDDTSDESQAPGS